MADFGMQMPGGKVRHGPTPDVYSALMALACVALVAACVVVYQGAARVGPDGNAIGVQDPDNIKLPGR